jgi:hypothetical protein
MWTKSVTTFEQFLQSEGLELQNRREDPDISDSKLVEYGNRDIRVQVVCDRGVWSVMFSAPSVGPQHWYSTQTLRDLLLGPKDEILLLDEQIKFVESNWPSIISRFGSLEREDTQRQLQLLQVERAKRRWPNWFSGS